MTRAPPHRRRTHADREQQPVHEVADLALEIRDRAVVRMEDTGRAIRQVSYTEHEGRKYAAALVGPRHAPFDHAPHYVRSLLERDAAPRPLSRRPSGMPRS